MLISSKRLISMGRMVCSGWHFALEKCIFLCSGWHFVLENAYFHVPDGIFLVKNGIFLWAGEIGRPGTGIPGAKTTSHPDLDRGPPQNESFGATKAHAANPSPCRVQVRPVRSGHQVRSGKVRSGQVRSVQVRSGQASSGQVRSGQT